MRNYALLCALAMAPPASGAFAAAPQPVKTAPLGMYAGRWYLAGQIAKTNHHPCPAGTEDFSTTTQGAFAVKMTCREASGDSRQVNAHVAIVPNSGNAKFRMSFLGGLIHQEYWVLDHAADGTWALMATPGGNYLWLLTRRPILDPVTRAAAATSIHALGYDVARLTTDR